MPSIQISDQLYREAQSRAAGAGFANVDAYIADVLKQELQDEVGNLDDFFTPERIAQIQEAEAEVARGEVYTWEETKIELAKRRAEWIRQNPTVE
jgi:hypothetical protein